MKTELLNGQLSAHFNSLGFLVAGLLVFFAIHWLPSIPSLRQRLVKKIGTTAYRTLFALIAIHGLALAIYGKMESPNIPVWDPPFWAILVPVVTMPFVFILLLCTYFPSNIKCATRHPMLLGVVLWSTAHLTINGDLASMILFGSFGVFSLLTIWLINHRETPPEKQRLPIFRDITAVAGGLVVFIVVLYFHNTLFGVSTFQQ
ncbi:NnrU family protein [Kaarinaea lacus]